MKNNVKKHIRITLLLSMCLFQLQFNQIETGTLSNLGKGIIYLKEKRIIKNILLKEIKPLFITYEKDGSLHDRMIDEINNMEFIDAKPEPVVLAFENNKPVFKKIIPKLTYQERNER